FDANGSVDLLWWNSTTGQAALGRTNGISASTAGIIWTEPNTDWRIAGAGDLDGDGKADIVWHNRTTGQVYGMQTNGSSVTNGAMMYTEPNTQWEIVSVGNYNGDNKADLLWWNQQTGQLYVMPMNGLSVASGGSLLYTEPDLTWHIQGETEWRDNVYGKGVTTTSASGSVAAGVSIEVDTAQVGGAVRDLFGVNKNPRASQFVGSSNMYNVSALYQQLGVSHVRTHDCGLDLCGTYKDATLYDMTTATPTVLTGTCTAAGVNAPPQLKWNVNNAADVNNPDNYNFTEVDRVIANALEAGAAVYLRLGQTFNGPSMTDDPDAWSKVAVNIYKHVIGQFKPSGVSVDPVAVEVYNEPDGGFWKGSKSDFMIYFNNTVDGVRGAAAAAGKSLRIGGPGFTNELVNHSTTTQNVASTFVETATLGRLDFLSAHHYNGCSNATLARAADWFDSVRALLASKGYPQSKPLDVSEYNIGLGNTCGNSFFSEAQVQSFTSGILTLMQGVNEWNIERAMFYSGFPLMGLMTVNASITGVVTVNPSAWALWAHSQLKGGTLVSAVTCVNNSSCVSGKAAASSSIVALAAKMSAGGYRIIVTNMTGEEKTYSLNLKGLTTSSAGIQIRTPLTTAQTVAAVKSGSDYYPTTSAITGLMATISTRSLTLPVLSGTATSSSLTLPAWSLNVIDVAP
ncbi:MAG: VCBS repeat-containing protein, partial [Desulfuromonadales bacterium]